MAVLLAQGEVGAGFEMGVSDGGTVARGWRVQKVSKSSFGLRAPTVNEEEEDFEISDLNC